MKNFNTLIFCITFFLIVSSNSFATIKQTVANGDWNNAANWSPIGAPLSEDTVMVSHDMTATAAVEFGASWFIMTGSGSFTSNYSFAIHGNIKIYGEINVPIYAEGDGNLSYYYQTVVAEIAALSNPEIYNYGTFTMDTLAFSSQFHNYGFMDIGSLTMSDEPVTNHTGAAIVANIITMDTQLDNQINATIETDSLTSTQDFINNGSISMNTWVHTLGDASGVTGNFCIAECFVNFASISGTVDVCDATPGNIMCDWDFGTIAGTVTMCSSSPCGSNVGIEEIKSDLLLSPNPANSFIMIQTNETISTYNIHDMEGRIVFSGTANSNNFNIDISELNGGVYIIVIKTEKGLNQQRFIKS